MSANDVLSIRQSLGLTQEELADRLGVSHVAVHYWETGKRTPGGPATILLRQLQAQLQLAERKISSSA